MESFASSLHARRNLRAAYVKGRRGRHWPRPRASVIGLRFLRAQHQPRPPRTICTNMAVGPGITEIPDSEDEPFTSSPDNTFSGAADKLCATPRGAVQDVQDTSQDVANPDQATTEHVGNDTDERTDNLDVDRDNASINDHAPVQTEGVLSQRSIINTNTPQEQRDLFLPQTQTAGLNANSEASLRPVADHAPFAGQQCTNAVMMDSGDQTDTILENQDMDVSSHSEHYESSGLLDDHVEQDRPETVVNQGSASTGIDQPKEPCPALSVSDAVEPLPVQSAFPAVGAATTDALPRTLVESSHQDAEHPASNLASNYAVCSKLPSTKDNCLQPIGNASDAGYHRHVHVWRTSTRLSGRRFQVSDA
jgi:hypothetical protein